MKYINPDVLYNRDHEQKTFIHTTDGLTVAEGGGTSHDILIWDHSSGTGKSTALKGRYTDYSRAAALDKGDLVGRSGTLYTSSLGVKDRRKTIHVVSFWNTDPAHYALLPSCLEDLKRKRLVNDRTYVSTPLHGVVPIANVMSGAATASRPDDAEKREMEELAKKMHVMRGAEKRDAMKKLGVGGGGKPHPMQTAMDYAGLRQPGQKWWAMQSEGMGSSLGGKLSRTLESL